MKIGLISCTKKKLQKKAPARILYSASPLFSKAWEYCITNYDECYILSAKHGLLHPDKEIEPYDESLNDMRMTERAIWTSKVLPELLKIVTSEDIVYFHAGVKYREYLIPALETYGIKAEVPLSGLGIGRQLNWYNNRSKMSDPHSSFLLGLNHNISTKETAEIIDERTAKIGDSPLRVTPPGQKKVDELVFEGDVITTTPHDSGSKYKVIQVSCYKYYGLPAYTIVFVDVDVEPNKDGSYRDTDLRWINECVAQDERILGLFEANKIEVIVTGKQKGQQSLFRFR